MSDKPAAKDSSRPQAHRAGFVNIIGRPNVGKSTLCNALVGEQLSIINAKAQTTRHRILGIVNGPDHQIVFSDTPGFIDDPAYKLQEKMNRFVQKSFADADVILFVTSPEEQYKEDDPFLLRIREAKVPLMILVNKVDLLGGEKTKTEIEHWVKEFPKAEVLPISALHKHGISGILEFIQSKLPVHPPYFDKEALTDRPERFFASEIIREKILHFYHQEIPYSVQVELEKFKEDDRLIKIRAIIYTNRQSQKAIIIGKEGRALKKMGTAARIEMEKFFMKKIFLELFVKVKEGWRDADRDLKHFGYES